MEAAGLSRRDETVVPAWSLAPFRMYFLGACLWTWGAPLPKERRHEARPRQAPALRHRPRPLPLASYSPSQPGYSFVV